MPFPTHISVYESPRNIVATCQNGHFKDFNFQERLSYISVHIITSMHDDQLNTLHPIQPRHQTSVRSGNILEEKKTETDALLRYTSCTQKNGTPLIRTVKIYHCALHSSARHTRHMTDTRTPQHDTRKQNKHAHGAQEGRKTRPAEMYRHK